MTKRFTPSGKVFAIAAMLLVGAALAQLTDQTFSVTKCAGTSGKTGDAQTGLGSAGYTAAANQCRLCKADYDNEFEDTLQKTYGLQLRDSVDATIKQYNGDMNTYTNPYVCFENDGKQYQCQFPRKPNCEVYDHFGRCVRCICGYSLRQAAVFTDATTFDCVPNEDYQDYCAVQTQGKDCLACKWNRLFKDDEAFEFYDEPHAMLDFGLYTDSNGKKQCVDNSKSLANQASGIANCREYDKANPLRCKECHSRLYDLNTNVEWDANVDPSLAPEFETRTWPYFWQRKVHYDYYLSYNDDNTKANTCTRYPSGYAGLPSYLRKITYVGTITDQNTFGATMLDGKTAKCKDLGWDSSFRVDAVLVTANGYLSNATTTGLTNELLANQSLHLCAQAIQFCAQYNVRTITGNNDGSKNSENGVSYTGPTFSYLYGDTCKACKGDDTTNKKSYILTPDSKKCCELVLDNSNVRPAAFLNCDKATADCSKCAVCKDGFYFDNSNPSKCVAITNHNAQCTYDVGSQTSSPSCKTCNLPYLYNGNANPTAGNECKTWSGASDYFYAPWRTTFIEWGCAGYSGTDPKSSDCLSQSTGSVIDSVRCTINDGFKLQAIQGSSTVKRCGCETDYASPLNWAYCRDKSNLPTGCTTVVSKGSKYCIECQPGYQLLPDGQCVSVATSIDWTNCVSWTSTNNCRLCDTANGYFLDYDTLTCIKGTFKPVATTSTDVAEGMAGCLFGKSQGTNKPYDCFQCALGYYLDKATWGTGTSAATVQTCVPLNYEAQAALKASDGKKPDTIYKLILSTGKWSCKEGEVDAFVIDWVQRASGAWQPTFATNLPGPTPFTFPRTQCRVKIDNCDLYDAQATKSCFLCRRINSKQYAVQEANEVAGQTAAQCVECSGNFKLVRSIEGKWVCSKSLDDKCLAYQWDTNDYYCAECVDGQYLDVNRKCVTTCDTTTKKPLDMKLWNGWKGVKGCVFKDLASITTVGTPANTNSLFAFEPLTGTETVPKTSSGQVLGNTVKYTQCDFYRRVSDTVTECVQCDQSTVSTNEVTVLAPLLKATDTISATTVWYCAVVPTNSNDHWGWEFATANTNTCEDGANSGCAKFTTFTRIDLPDPVGQSPTKKALPLGYNTATNAVPCTVSDLYGTGSGPRYTLVLDQGVVTGSAAGSIAFVQFPRCVQDTFVTLKLNTQSATGAIKSISQTLVKFQDTGKNYFYTPDANKPVQGCASLYDPATPGDAQSITYASADGSDATGRCCRCQPGLQAYTLNDLKAVKGANFDTDITASTSAKCNIVYCGRRQYFNSDLTTPINKNCLTSDHTNAVKSTTCVFCEPGFALNLATATGTCVSIPSLGNNNYVKENFACLQSTDTGNKCKVCAWPLIPAQTGATAADPVCRWPAWNSIESTNSGDNSVFVTNKGCSWPYFLNYTGVCQEKPTNCTQVTGTFDYTANGRHFSFYQYADLSALTWTDSATNKALYNLDLARGTCKTCVGKKAPQYGVCLPYCTRVQRQWNAKTYRFDVTCCTCDPGYAFIGGSNNCTKCPDNCASCTFDGTTAKCSTCKQGYYLTGTSCAECDTTGINGCATFDTVNVQSAAAPAKPFCICLTCTLQTGEFTNFRYYDQTSKTCKTKTVITNCILYETGSSEGCQTCASGYFLTKNTDRKTDTCTQYNQANCAVYKPTENKCQTCNDPFYADTDGTCKNNAITNCQRYDQTATPPGSKCLLCTRGQTATTSFALDAEGKNCIQYSTTVSSGQSQPANVKFCFQYDARLDCIKCNNYDESNQDALYVETLASDVQGIFALVSGETDRSRQCQFMYYCQAAVKSLTTTYDYFYRCTKCLNTITYTKPSIDKQRVVQFVGRDYGKMYYKNEEDSQQLADPSPQCVSLKGLGGNAVEACTSYQLSDTNKPKPALSTAQSNPNTYPIAAVAKQNCLSCLPDYTPEVYLKDMTSGTFCKFQQTACNIAACQQYDINTKYEFLQCFTCNTTYNSNRYVLNSDSQFCDLTTARNETIPAYTPLYTGIDDGIYAKYDPNYKPSGNDARALSFAVLAVLAALFALLA